MRRKLLALALLLGCAPEDGGESGSLNASPECEAFCDIKLSCDPDLDPKDPKDLDDCLLGCTLSFYNASSIDQMVCPMLLLRVYDCVNELGTCAEFDAWDEREGDPYPCEPLEAEYCLNCGGC